MAPTDWTVTEVQDGFVVGWRGQSWGMEPRDKAWCLEYVERLKVRYPGGAAWLVASYGTPRVRGGPWRWTAPDGQTEVIHTGRLSDAKAVLRHGLRRKTLPRGLTWTLEERS
jgi:hypothetical protein